MEKEVSEVDSTPLEVRGLAWKPCLLWDGFPAIHGNHGDHGMSAWRLEGVIWPMPSPSPQESMITAEVIKHKVPCTLLCDRLLLSHLNPDNKMGLESWKDLPKATQLERDKLSSPAGHCLLVRVS